MALTIAEANGWNHLVRWLTGKLDQEDWALHGGQVLSKGAEKKLQCGIGEREFTEEVWPRLLKLREALAADTGQLDTLIKQRAAEFGVTPQPVYGVAHPDVFTVPITSWAVATATHDALPDDAELVVRVDGDDEWLRYEGGEPVEVRTW